MVLVGGKQFSDRAVKIALQQHQNNATGQRVSFMVGDRISKEGVQAFKFIKKFGFGGKSGARFRQEGSRGSALRIATRKAGFKDPRLFQAVTERLTKVTPRQIREVSKISQNLQTTRQGIRDIRTGRIIAPIGTKISTAAFLAQAQPELRIQEIQKKKFKEIIREGVAREAEKKMSIKEPPINIFSVQAWKDLGSALVKSESKSDIKLGQRILSAPLFFVTEFASRFSEIEHLPAGLLALTQKPENIKQILPNMLADFKGTIQLLRTSPSRGLGRIGADIFTFIIIGGSLRLTGKVSSNVATRLDPRFVGVAKTGAKLKIKGTGKDRIISLDVVKSIPKKSLREQVKLSGKEISAISSQADSLLNIISRKRVIRKPIPNEAKFNKATKQLLAKFDEGKINKRELLTLENLIRKQGEKGILERSFFADPSGKIRPSRLGVVAQREASFKDLLSGQATLKKSKPQILLFEDIKIQKFPKSLQDVKNKILRNQPLTRQETARLLKWQQLRTGKFKPLGFVTREAEITLAPGEIIKRIRVVAVTIIEGKRVPIISVKVVKPTKVTSNLIKKARVGKATKIELKQLSRKLKRESGFNYSTSSLKSTKRYLPIKRKALSSIIKRVSRRKVSKPVSRPRKVSKPVSRPSPKKPTKPTRPSKPVSKPSPKKPAKPSKPVIGISRPPKRPPVRPPRKPPILRLKFTKKIKKLKKPVQGFFVAVKRKGKFVNVDPVPFILKDARDVLAYSLDKRLVRTGEIIPAGKVKNIGITKSFVKGYFNKNKKKLRPFKIRRGVKKQLIRKFIEKKAHVGDTKSEIRELRAEKRRKAKRKQKVRVRKQPKRKAVHRITKKPKRTLSPAQKKALAKGRKGRLDNIKKRK